MKQRPMIRLQAPKTGRRPGLFWFFREPIAEASLQLH